MTDRRLETKVASTIGGSTASDKEAGNVKHNYEKVLAVRDYIHKKRFRHSNTQQGWRLYRKTLVAEAELGDETAKSLMFAGLEKPHIVSAFLHASAIRPLPCFDEGSTNDTRVWDAFENWTISAVLTQCGFLSGKLEDTEKKRRDKGVHSKRSLWWTSKATPFQACLFFMCLGMVSNSTSPHTFPRDLESEPPRKRMKHGDYVTFPAYKRTRQNSQRIGFVIQTITTAWDQLAKFASFESCEELLYPYLVWHSGRGFYPIELDKDGFSPLKQMYTLKDISATTNPGEVHAGITKRSQEMDAAVRRLAKLFMNDIWTYAVSNDLFLHGENPWEHATRFAARAEGKLPKHFIDREEIGQLLEALGTPLKSPKGSSTGSDFAPESPVIAPDASSKPDTVTGKRKRQPSRTPLALCDERCPCNHSREILRAYMKNYIRLYNCSFKDLTTRDEDYGPLGQSDVTGTAQLVLTDPPYNIRRELGRSNSYHDRISKDEIKEAVSQIDKVLRPGGHAIVFCSSMQFPIWVRAFQSAGTEDDSDVEDDASDSDSEANSSASSESASGSNQDSSADSADSDPDSGGSPNGSFNVDFCEMTFLNEHGSMPSLPRLSTSLVNVTQKAVHAVKRGQDQGTSFRKLKSFGHIPSRFPPYVNAMDNVPRLEPGESIRFTPARGDNGDEAEPDVETEPAENQRSIALRPEQKPVALMKELICRYTEPGDMVVDFFGGTFSTARACLTISKNQRLFAGSEMDSNCYEIARKSLENEFARLLLENELRELEGSTCPDHVKDSARMVVAHSKRFASRNQQKAYESWMPPRGFPSMSVLPEWITSFLGSLWAKEKEMDTFKKRSPSLWSRELQGLFQTVHVGYLRTVEAVRLGVAVAPSKILHKGAGEGLFARKSFKKGEIICAYYGSIVYEDLSQRVNPSKRYGHGLMGATVADFLKCSMRLTIERKAPGLRKRNQELISEAFVVAAPFCVGGFINDGRYISGDAEEQNSGERRRNNVKFKEKRPQGSTRISHIVDCDALQIEATRDISPGEELYADYGDEYFDDSPKATRRSKEAEKDGDGEWQAS